MARDVHGPVAVATPSQRIALCRRVPLVRDPLAASLVLVALVAALWQHPWRPTVDASLWALLSLRLGWERTGSDVTFDVHRLQRLLAI